MEGFRPHPEDDKEKPGTTNDGGWDILHGFEKSKKEKREKEEQTNKIAPAQEAGEGRTHTESTMGHSQASGTEQGQEPAKTEEAASGSGFIYHREQKEKREQEDKEKLEDLEKELKAEGAIEKIKKITEKIKERSKLPESNEEENRKFKEDIIKELIDNKEIIQQADSARVKRIYADTFRRKGSEYMPLGEGRKERFWRKRSTRAAYDKAWIDLATWANEKKIWDEKDKNSFRKETRGNDQDSERERELDRLETLKIMGINTVAGVLHGGIYMGAKAFMLPWKGFMAGLEFALEQAGFGNLKDIETGFKAGLSVFLDQEKTNKMAGRIFGSKEKQKKEKAKAKGKEEQKPTYAKELQTKIDIKNTEIKYRIGLKDLLRPLTQQEVKEIEELKEYRDFTTQQEKMRFKEKIRREKYTEDLKKSKDYADCATNEERDDFIDEEQQQYDRYGKAYRDSWAKMREYWIINGVWNADNEKQFREEIYFLDNESYRRNYMLTVGEGQELSSLRERLRKENKKVRGTKPLTEEEIKKQKKEISGKIKQNQGDIQKRDETIQLEEDLRKLDEDQKTEATIKWLTDQKEKIENKAEDRAKDFSQWPLFTAGKKGKKDQEQIDLLDDVEDEHEDLKD